MSSSYSFLAHDIFQQNVADFLEKHPAHKKQLLTNLEKARSNPFSGKPMHSLPKKLRQKVFRLWIGGKKGFRFIYFVHRESHSVLGIYVTLVPRAQFSYDSRDWIEILDAIVADLEKGHEDKFSIMNTEAAVKAME